jgi:hypothetical protein
MSLSLSEYHYTKDCERKQASGIESIRRRIYIWVVRVSTRIGIFGILRNAHLVATNPGVVSS